MKKIIICIHGFKTGSYHDFDIFDRYVQEQGYDAEVVKINLYDMNQPKTFKHRKWKRVILNEVSKYSNSEEYCLYVIGYSMGCGVACYLASKMKLDKLVLIAPLFHLLGSKMVLYNIKLYFKSLKMKIFNRKKLKKMQRFKLLTKKVVPIKLTWNVTMSTYTYRRYVRKVRTPTLVMLGLDDDYSPIRSAHYAFKKIKSRQKELWFIDHLNHLFIFSPQLAPNVFAKVLDFLSGATITTIYK